jgi:predicted phosphodiesterase
MKIRLLSDLHYEFHADGGKEAISRLDPEGCDVVVLAGDVSNAWGIEQALHRLAERFAPRPVLFIAGNHEFYGGSAVSSLLGEGGCESVRARIRRIQAAHPNLRWLERELMTHMGVRFLGCSLWFAKSSAPKDQMNDFRQIPDFEKWVYAESDAGAEFLMRECRPGDVVITHYLPCVEAIAPRWRGSPLNAFFMRDMRPVILERRPALWLFGHTHDSVRTQVADTQLVCNPFGYAAHEENPDFDPSLTLEIP